MLISLALDFRRTGIGSRERFHLSREELTRLYAEPAESSVSELMLLSTCNRIELYAWSHVSHESEVAAIQGALAERWTGSNSSAAELLALATHRTGADAVRHLLRVAAGLESQVLGDSQVLHQVRKAYAGATGYGAVGPRLHRLLQMALRAGRRVRRETGLGRDHLTMGAAAARFAAARAGGLTGRGCVVVGAGKTAGQVLRQLVGLGATRLVVVNRTPEAAWKVAQAVGASSLPLAALHQAVADTDVAILATGADRPLLTSQALEAARAVAGRADTSLLVVDLGMPRNAEPSLARLRGVSIVDLDALHPALDSRNPSAGDVTAAERIVEDAATQFAVWLRDYTARRAPAESFPEVLDPAVHAAAPEAFAGRT